MISLAGSWLARCQIYASDGIVGQIRGPLNDRLWFRIRVQWWRSFG